MSDAAVMAGKFVLVTGGTGGIGRATAIGLAALGARVGITGRDQARAEAAAASICTAPGSPAVDAFAADMSAQAGVRRLAAQVAGTYPWLDVLVNNVGGFWAHRQLTRVVTVSSAPTPAAGLTSAICRASGTTPGSARTASPSWPT